MNRLTNMQNRMVTAALLICFYVQYSYMLRKTCQVKYLYSSPRTCPQYGTLKTQCYGNWICFRPQVRGWEAPTLLDQSLNQGPATELILAKPTE
jgi:hypothetical protein